MTFPSLLPGPNTAVAPAMLTSEQSSGYRYMSTNLLTGQVQADWLPMEAQNFTRMISGVGTFTGSLVLGTDVSLNQLYISALEPRRSVLWAYQDTKPIWAGIVWDWVPESEVNGLLAVNASTIESLFARRIIEDDMSFVNVDVFDIFRALLAYALAKQPNGNVPNILVPSGESGNLITATYAATDLQSVADAWANLVALGNFEYTFAPSATVDGIPAFQLQLGYPQLGQPASVTGLMFQLPGNLVDDVFTRMGSAGANKIIATATGTVPSGPWPVQWNGNGINAFPGVQSEQLFGATQGQTFGVSFSCYSPQGWSGDYGNTGVWAQIAWYDSNFNLIGETVNQPVVPLVAGTAVTVDSGQQTPPVNASFGQAVLQATETPPASTQFFAQPLPQATNYFTNGFIIWTSTGPAGNGSTCINNSLWREPQAFYTGNGTSGFTDSSDQLLPVVAGQSYGVAYWGASPTGWANGNGVGAGIFWYDINFNFLSSPSVQIFGLPAALPILIDSGLQVAPAGAAFAQVVLFPTNAPPPGVQFYAWAAVPSSGSTVVGYLTETPGLTFYGAPNASNPDTWQLFTASQNTYPAFTSQDSPSTDLIDIANGYPLLEKSVSYQGSVAINSQAAVDAFAQGLLSLYAGTPATPVAYLGGKQMPLINQVNLGDGCYLTITSPTYPARADGSPGLQVTGRVVGWTLQPPGYGQVEQAQIQLGAMQVEESLISQSAFGHFYTGGPGN